MEKITKEIERKREELSQSVRNWNGDEELFQRMMGSFQQIRFMFDQLRNRNGATAKVERYVEGKKNIDSQ